MIPEKHQIRETQYWVIEKTYIQNGRYHQDRVVDRSLSLDWALNSYDNLESTRDNENIRYEVVKVMPCD